MVYFLLFFCVFLVVVCGVVYCVCKCSVLEWWSGEIKGRVMREMKRVGVVEVGVVGMVKRVRNSN